MLSPDALVEIGLPIASGATVWTALREPPQGAVVAAVARQDLDARLSVLGDPVGGERRVGSVSRVTGPACSSARI